MASEVDLLRWACWIEVHSSFVQTVHFVGQVTLWTFERCLPYWIELHPTFAKIVDLAEIGPTWTALPVDPSEEIPLASES